MSMNYIKIAFYSLSILFVFSCRSVNPQYGPKPPALGKMNEIVVIADDDLWQGMIGDTFKFYFGSAYPIMPTPEPIFDIRHFTPEQLTQEPLRKELRTYVILGDLSNNQSATSAIIANDLGQEKYKEALSSNTFTTSVGKNKWAEGQLVIYLFANNKDALAKVISESFPGVAKRVNQHDNDQLGAMTYAGSTYKSFSNDILEKYGFQLGLPAAYKLAKNVDDLSWYRKDDREYIINLVFDTKEYTSQKQLSKDSIVAWIGDYGQMFEFTDLGSNIYVDDVNLPLFDYNKEIDGAYCTEIRGVWAMDKDFKGGPFFAYSILNEDSQNVIYIMAYVFAPGKDKRDKMQQLEYIVNSIKF